MQKFSALVFFFRFCFVSFLFFFRGAERGIGGRGCVCVGGEGREEGMKLEALG
jgi:hypothetical protein